MYLINVKFASGIQIIHFGFDPYTPMCVSTVYTVLSLYSGSTEYTVVIHIGVHVYVGENQNDYYHYCYEWINTNICLFLNNIVSHKVWAESTAQYSAGKE